MKNTGPPRENPGAVDGTGPHGWLDGELSEKLADIADRGENEAVEFKSIIPEQTSSLAKEIAGFASTHAGRIFLGIEDDGTIVGIEGCDTHEGRNKIRSRIEGIVNTVKPLVQTRLTFASPGGADAPVVIVLDVPKGGQPVYYSRDVPYLRQMTAARPMTPDEVITHVRAWDKDRKPSADIRYLGDLAKFLIDVDVMLSDKRARRPNPWAQSLRLTAGFLASQARAIAATAPANLAETNPVLETMAVDLETLATERPVLKETSAEIYGAMDDLDRMVAHIRARWVPPETFSEDSIAHVRKTVSATAKQLDGLTCRVAERKPRTRYEDVKEEVGERGMDLLRCASVGIGLGPADRVAELRNIAVALRNLETRRIYFDGGASINRLIEDISDANGQLRAWLEKADF